MKEQLDDDKVRCPHADRRSSWPGQPDRVMKEQLDDDMWDPHTQIEGHHDLDNQTAL